MQFACILLFCIVFFCYQNDFCEYSIGSVYVGGYCGPSESGICIFGKLCSVGFRVVCKSSLFLLHAIVMSYVDCRGIE